MELDSFKDGDIRNVSLIELEGYLPGGYKATPGSGVGLINRDMLLTVVSVNRAYNLATIKVSTNLFFVKEAHFR